MKRFLLLVVIAALAAAVLWSFFWRSSHTSSAAITALLPKETLAFIHLPDLKRARAELHRSDLYQIWSEPAVQEFLRKPRAKIPGVGFGETFRECESIDMKDAFAAVISVESNVWKIVGGFRFKGKPEDAEKIVAGWRAKFIGQLPEPAPTTVEYEGHSIRTDSVGVVQFSTVSDGQWFLVANDVEQLKPMLDRLDGRGKDPKAVLAADEGFAGAFKHMPASFTALGYARIDHFVEKFMPIAKGSGAAGSSPTLLGQLHTFCCATAFDGGKIRDTIFVGMPKLIDAGNLTRGSLALGTRDTFLYAAGFLNLTQQMQLPHSQMAAGWTGGLQKFAGAMNSNGVTIEDWKSAFGSEFGLLGDWPASARLPALLATLPVKDSARANKIVAAITTHGSEAADWTHQEKNGVHYFSTHSGGQFFSFSPTFALSDRMLIAGADEASVEVAMKRSRANGGSELAATNDFQNSDRSLPTAKQGFGYLNPALLYARLDAALRPMLFMSAAFLPGLADTVDLSKLPAPEVITKHLSPIGMSQNYDGDGYVTESIGPVTLYQTLVGMAAVVEGAMLLYRNETQQSTIVSASSVAPATSIPSIAPPAKTF